ncbi:MAG TPA: hypothetical protein VNN07_01745 [Candidatus Tectomicrobia bacterium]|nr:hypothetical protein [Candidatus Tectomicrobia bacterium]
MNAGTRAARALFLVVLVGGAAIVPIAHALDRGRPALARLAPDEPPYLSPEAVRRMSLGFNGLVADWYWLTTLQYIGRRIETERAQRGIPMQRIQMDQLKAVDPAVLVPLVEMIVTLDPRFTAVYEFAAVVLPAVDVEASVRIVERGIRDNPEQWYLHQQLAYIHWQRGDSLSAAEAFRRGARLTTARWMASMADRLFGDADDPMLARDMYARMEEQAKDEHIREWARGRRMQAQAHVDRRALRRVLAAYRERHGRCPAAWPEVAADLQSAAVPLAPPGFPVDPGGTPYVLVIGAESCDVTLHPGSSVPRA